MTVATKYWTQSNQINCEIRSPDSKEVFGYVVLGNGASSLEQALTANGFWLVPISAHPTPDLKPAPAAA